MTIQFKLPDIGEGVAEGEIVRWIVAAGAAVEEHEPVVEVMTDKATVEIPSPAAGVVTEQLVSEGETVPVGTVIFRLSVQGAASSAPAPAAPAPAAAAAPAAAPAAEVPAPRPADAKVLAVPSARRVARELGVDLAMVSGTGNNGVIRRRDVEAFAAGAPQSAPAAAPAASAPAAAPAPAARPEAETRVPFRGVRKKIAEAMVRSKFTAPHFYLTVDVDMTAAIAFRAEINALTEKQGLAKVSFNDLVTKAAASALGRHPYVNASYLEDEGVIRQHAGVHVAIAVAMPEGLITPVVRDADRKGLAAIAAETRELAGRARDGKLDPSEYAGSTFTTSNLGMFGISEFTAILNPPNACILAIGGICDEPVVKDGAVVPGKRMALTLTCDHRVVDGATGAAFLGDVQAMLENPSLMLV